MPERRDYSRGKRRAGDRSGASGPAGPRGVPVTATRPRPGRPDSLGRSGHSAATRGVAIARLARLTSLGTAQEALAEELRRKAFLPVDQATRDVVARIAARLVSQAAE